MPTKSLAIAAFALSLAALATLAFARDIVVLTPQQIAGMTDNDLVSARQAAMKEDGMMLQAAAGATGDDAIEIASTVLENFSNFPLLFREGSITDKSGALPIIWEQWDQFEGLLKKGQGLAADMQAAAEADDPDSWAEALNSFKGLCGECHMTYRARR